MKIYKPSDEFVARLHYRIHDGSEPGVRVYAGGVLIAKITTGNKVGLELGLDSYSLHDTVAGALQALRAKLKENQRG